MMFLQQDYGLVRLRLKELLQQQGISRNQLARQAGTSFATVDRWCKGEIDKLDCDLIARFCYVLGCSVGDLLEYEKEE